MQCDKDTRRIIYGEAISEWGQAAQFLQAAEEASELIKEIIKLVNRGGRKEKVFDEIADVEIMCEQMREIFRAHEGEIDEIKDYKIKRLANRISLHKGGTDFYVSLFGDTFVEKEVQ